MTGGDGTELSCGVLALMLGVPHDDVRRPAADDAAGRLRAAPAAPDAA